MDNAKFISLLIVVLFITCISTAHVSADESKNHHGTKPHLYYKDLTLIGDAKIMCWYGNNEQLGEGMYCFFKPLENMKFLETHQGDPPSKKSPTNSSPSSSKQSNPKIRPANFTQF